MLYVPNRAIIRALVLQIFNASRKLKILVLAVQNDDLSPLNTMVLPPPKIVKPHADKNSNATAAKILL